MSLTRRRVSLSLVSGAQHYDHVIGAIRDAKVSVWISTANVKDVRVEAPIGTSARARGRYVSIVEVLRDLSRRGVDVRILHATSPSRAFQASFGRATKRAAEAVHLRQCVRLHTKMIAIDGSLLYLGSANFTGAGLGAKAETRRNFEAGILTDDEHLLDQMQSWFDDLWRGRPCSGCGRRRDCPKPIDSLPPTR